MATAILDNPIGWAQFRLVGGWKNLILTCLAYAAIFGGLMFGFARAQSLHVNPANMFMAFAELFLGLQVLALLIYGSLRVGMAVRSDVKSGVIESHRLMPVSSPSAVLGYLLGAPIQALSLFVVNLLLGAVATSGAGLPLDSWMLSNAILLVFALFIWMIILFFSFRIGPLIIAMIFGLLIVLSIMAGNESLILVPAANLLASPLIGHTIFDPRHRPAVDAVPAAAMFAQLFIAGLYFIAAGRRYRDDEAVGFDPTLGLLLLTAWVALCITGAGFLDELRPYARYYAPRPEAQFVISFAIALLLAMLPVASAVRADAHDRHTRRWSVPPLVVALISAVISLGMLYTILSLVSLRIPVLRTATGIVSGFPVTGPDHLRIAVLRTAIVALAFLISVRYLLGIARRRKLWPRRILFGWLILTWSLPMLLEAFRQAWTVDDVEPHLSQLAMCSPVVEVFQNWSTDPSIHSARFQGLAVQCGLAVLLIITYYVGAGRNTAIGIADS
jgi:hypothetical protein